jgi:hypothetical protein
MSPAGFEPAIPTNERQQTHILDRAASDVGSNDLPSIIVQAVQISKPLNLFQKKRGCGFFE